MPNRAKQTFGVKLIRLVTLTSLVAVMLVCAVLVWVNFYRGLTQAENTLEAESQLIAIHSAAALSFGDKEAGQETLAALGVLPQVGSAQLYDKNGKVFATYFRREAPGPPEAATAVPGVRYHDTWVVSEQPVMHNRDRLGTLVISYDLSVNYARLRGNILLAVAVGVLSTCVALLLAIRLHNDLARPIEALVTTASAVSQTNDFSVRAPKFSDDEIGRFTDVFNDMLERIGEQAAEITAAHDKLAATNEELRQKNVEMEQFVYTVSHDLKSPLVTAMGFVGLLKEDAAAGRMDDALDSVAHIARAAQRMSRLIDDLLSLSRIGRVRNDPERVDVNELVANLVGDLRPRIEQAGVTVEVQPRMPVLIVDRSRLAQVFDNLINNALKYGSSNPQPRITIGGMTTATDIRFFVRDNGPGIPPEYHERIFGLFQRLDQKHEGTGIGLAIVARIMDVHGGKAWVESTPGQGATFWIAFPSSGGRPLTTDAKV